MKNVFATVRWPAIVSFILVLPFMALELINRQAFRPHEGFPITLFVVLWLLPVAFFLILSPTIRNVRAENKSRIHPTTLVLSAAALMLIAGLWGSVILDQMPCFLGVPYCA
jgi:cation transport ATPase